MILGYINLINLSECLYFLRKHLASVTFYLILPINIEYFEPYFFLGPFLSTPVYSSLSFLRSNISRKKQLVSLILCQWQTLLSKPRRYKNSSPHSNCLFIKNRTQNENYLLSKVFNIPLINYLISKFSFIE